MIKTKQITGFFSTYKTVDNIFTIEDNIRIADKRMKS